ncbi:MAG: hypothetical protein KBF32_03115 [Chitinophagales bacterium]|nr:hypothetical protein [Chitinophagaceae bacterium]MBP9882367.1 hypothetical protein [Chitinophagales bacterium]
MKIINTAYFYKALGLYQVFGAFYGIYALFSSFSFLNMFTSLPFIVLLIVSGIWLLIDLNHKSYKLAFFNQLIQTIQFKLFGYGLMYAAGIYLSLAYDAWSIEQLYLDIRSWTFIFSLFFNSSENQFLVAINSVPIVILLLMILFKKAVFQPTQSKIIRSADQL